MTILLGVTSFGKYSICRLLDIIRSTGFFKLNHHCMAFIRFFDFVPAGQQSLPGFLYDIKGM